MTELPSHVADAIEQADLPVRLKDQIRASLKDRSDVTEAQVDDIVKAVENKYLHTRVDPLDPVGTVSAQSIGEPGTQMSIPYDERVLVRRDGVTEVTEIGPLVDTLLDEHETRETDGHEVAKAPAGLSVLSLRSDERVRWKPVEEVSRHDAPEDVLRFELESGREIRATRSHSFVTRRNNEVVPVTGASLEVGDWLPVVGSFDVPDGETSVDLTEYFPSTEYWHTSLLTDGGVAALPVGGDQIRNKREALDAGSIDDGMIYPVNATKGLPESFPLDEGTGFFVGAWLAEGNRTDHYVSVSNIEPAFQERIREFAARFGFSVNEYENTSGFAEGYDIRVNGTILAAFLERACMDDGEKTVPDFSFSADERFVRGLLSGYFSGDGNVGRNSIRASSTSPRLLTGIAMLLARVGVYGRFGEQDDSKTLRIPKKYVPRFEERVGLVGKRETALAELASTVSVDAPDATDQIPNFGDALQTAVREAGLPVREVNSATNRQRIGRTRLERLVERIENDLDERIPELDVLERAVDGDVVWERIEAIEAVPTSHEHVYDFSVEGLETFTTANGVVTHNTMNTFHYAGVAEIDVTQGLPRLIELVDARKTPNTPMMTIYLDDDFATDRELAHEVVWNIEATRILALGDINTNVADMRVSIDLNPDTLEERGITTDEVAETIEDSLGVETVVLGEYVVEFGPKEPSYRDLLQLVEELREIVFKGIEEVKRVVIRKEQIDSGEEFVLYTEGSAFGDIMDIEGVDGTRSTTNNIHEIYRVLGVEAARESIIEETMDTLIEQGLDDVNIRHLMLVADIMTNRGEIQSIGRHGISGSKASVLARAAFEVTVNHLLDAAIHGSRDDLDGVTENVIVGKPIKLGTGDVDLKMRSVTDSSAD